MLALCSDFKIRARESDENDSRKEFGIWRGVGRV
jgi:hypothetical protein